MMKFFVSIFLFWIICVLNAEGQKHKYFDFEYSVEQIELHNAGLFGDEGWSLVDNKISSKSSRMHLDLFLSSAWFSNFGVELFSTEGFIPTERKRSDDFENSVSFLQLFWGNPEKGIPQLVFYQRIFRAKGVVDWNSSFYRKNKLLEIGETFNLETKYTTLQIKWRVKNFICGIGLSNFEILGNEEMSTATDTDAEYSVEEKSNYTGFVFSSDYNKEVSPFFKTPWLLFDYGGESEIALSKVGVLLKLGMHFGSRLEFCEDCFIKPWFGFYFWHMGAGTVYDNEWDFNKENQAANSDYGYIAGLKVRFAY